ncbi:helix-turn-helix domain-containing protein [Bacteroides ilei]
MSVRYLQKVVKDITGRTVYSYISERLRIYARRLLASSDMTIEQIAFR